jgi:hypothetical protein
MVDGGEVEPLDPWAPASEGVREIRHYRVRPERREKKEKEDRDLLSGGLLWVAGLIIAVSLTGAGYVAYESQRLFALAHNHGDGLRAAITGALPDAGWASMAIVALVAALRGRSSARARVGVVVFFGLSLGAQLMYAPRTIEGYLVAIIAPVTLAWMLESFVVEVRRWAGKRRGLELDETPVLSTILGALIGVPRTFGRLTLWWIRLFLDRKGTWSGARQWVLDEAPIAPGRTAASMRAVAALEQAGSVERAAEQARAEALAEVERIREQASEQVDATLQQTEQLVGTARADAAEQVQLAEQHAAQQLEQMRQTAEAQLQQVRQECTQQVRRRDQAIEDIRQEANEKLARMQQQNGQLAGDLDRLRAEYDRVIGAATSKTRLIAAYERLGAAGDPRWMDRDRAGEVARELFGAAGLSSEGTARAYLYDYIDGAKQGASA